MNNPKTNIDLKSFKEEGGIIIGVDVDTQRDFSDKNGALSVFNSTPAYVIPNIKLLTDSIKNKIGSVDTHAFDSWEFLENGGPFPRHCEKGTEGALKISESQSKNTRFIPMSNGNLMIGANTKTSGNREYNKQVFTKEVLAGVHSIFEKEVHTLFANPNAAPFIKELVEEIELVGKKVLFAVYGYCVGDYCADQAAQGLRQNGYKTAIIEDAVAPLNITHSGEVQNGMEVMKKIAKKEGIHLLKTNEILDIL